VVEALLRKGHLVTTAAKVQPSTSAAKPSLCPVTELAKCTCKPTPETELCSIFCKERNSAVPQPKPKHRPFTTEFAQEFEYEANDTGRNKTSSKSLGLL